MSKVNINTSDKIENMISPYKTKLGMTKPAIITRLLEYLATLPQREITTMMFADILNDDPIIPLSDDEPSNTSGIPMSPHEVGPYTASNPEFDTIDNTEDDAWSGIIRNGD